MDLFGINNGQHNHLKGILLMTGAGLCWSTGGIFVRSVDITNSWEIAFWRSLAMALVMAVLLSVRHSGRIVQSLTSLGVSGFLAGFFLAMASVCFILSVTRTTVANTLVIISTAPFLTALAARLFLGESVATRSYVAMAIALTGISAMCADSIGGGALIGNLLAGAVALAFAASVVLLRYSRAQADMSPTVLVAGVFALIIALPLSFPFHASWQDIGTLACMGTFQTGLGCVLMTLASRHISAAEIGLLSLLETTLGPVWVWIGVGERPSDLALLGGAVVVTSLVINELVGVYRPAQPSRSGETVEETVAVTSVG
jgi:drug/metabolite transporter (DMT)-like permease